ncbi:GIY-YIG nuclease family protein [Pelistega suis]|uniref:GIY-YIG nuclease family protein n=1 Tax=Pelistega suis TaxID=1631957 RepID=A0A849P3P4_9BURK|nr:GIY-YIG nuclease family protein [Pelistega suis]NOL51676.1 GIY-YIG nuclease family protein [Pelistega suis]
MKGKNINMFLMEGEVTGAVKCTLSNWTGVIYKIPRQRLTTDIIKNRSDLKQSGIYFLIGKNEEDKGVVYIGQAGNRKNGEGILLRILEHTKSEEKDYFDEVIILTTQNNSFGPTEISYLENTFTNLARQVNRYEVKNGNEPNVGNVTEEKESELDEIVENTKIIIGTLGHRLFVPMIARIDEQVAQIEDKEELKLFLRRKLQKTGEYVQAMCRRTSEGFVVLEGSMIVEVNRDACPQSLLQLRDELYRKGLIAHGGILKEKQLFKSPSYAAAFVLGINTNGRTEWKTEDGRTLKEIEEMEIEVSY